MQNPLVKILLVDDSDTTANRIEEILYHSATPSAFRIAISAKQAKSVIHAYHPDIIMIHESLEDCNSKDFIQYLMQENPTVQVIIITGNASKKYSNNFKEKFVTHCFNFNKKDGWESISNVLAGRNAAA
jgi:chemotaxis response regulator CheB